ncbi:MAG: site-specific integrase [Sedimentisphaerales bacterium]|nr:site-specific integrase [Sedimentisphaerales bacterium]
MRIYKPTYSKQLPKGAKIVTRKDGTYARFRIGRGTQKEARLTKAGDRILAETRHWHIAFEDHVGVRRALKGFTDQAATRRLADNVQRLVNCKMGSVPLDEDLHRAIEQLPGTMQQQFQQWHLLEPEQSMLGKPLHELVSMFEQTLNARERNPKYIYETITMASEVFEACGFRFWRDIKDQQVEGYVKDLREGCISDKRGKLRNISHRRSNAYLKACQSFCNWVVRDRKWTRVSPLQDIPKLNVKEDPRHTRRAITVTDLKRLLQKTAVGPERYGMTGHERYLLYRLAVETGLRRGEIARLRRADFDFDSRTVTLRPAKASKNKCRREQSLSAGLCEELREFLGSGPPDVKAFGGWYTTLTDKTAVMLREDLVAAGIPYKDDHGDFFDFHALRVECASLLIENGVDPKQAQEHLRHSSVGLTMDVYAKVVGGKQKARVVASLPDLSLPQREMAVAAGTDGPKSLSKSCFRDGRQRTIADNNCKSTPENASQSSFSRNDGGLARPVDPKVEGSSPFGLDPQAKGCQTLTIDSPLHFPRRRNRTRQVHHADTWRCAPGATRIERRRTPAILSRVRSAVLEQDLIVTNVLLPPVAEDIPNPN